MRCGFGIHISTEFSFDVRIQQSENTEAGSSFRRLHERTYRIFLAYFFLSWSSSTMSSIIITLFLNFKFLKSSTFEYQIVDLTMTPTVVTQWERHFRLLILVSITRPREFSSIFWDHQPMDHLYIALIKVQ